MNDMAEVHDCGLKVSKWAGERRCGRLTGVIGVFPAEIPVPERSLGKWKRERLTRYRQRHVRTMCRFPVTFLTSIDP